MRNHGHNIYIVVELELQNNKYTTTLQLSHGNMGN